MTRLTEQDLCAPRCAFSPLTGAKLHEPVGVEALRTDKHYARGWTHNPWSGVVRDAGDIAMDPHCQGVWDPSWGPLRAAPKAKAAPSALDVQEGGDHYRKMKIQPIEFIHANAIPWAEGSVIQYLVRWREKGGLEDVRKARHLLDMLIELEEKR